MCILFSLFTGNVGKQVDGREDNSKQTNKTSYGKWSTCTVYHKDIGVGLFHHPCINLSDKSRLVC